MSIPEPGSGTDLENGARPSTPTGDNLILDHIRATAAGYAAVADAGGGRSGELADLGLHMVDLACPSPFGNLAHLTAPVPEARTADLAAAMKDFFGARDGGPYLLFSPWPTGDLGAHGFVLGGHPPVMVRPAGGTPTECDDLRVVVATDPDELEAFERTLAIGYPASELLPFGSAPRLFGDGVLASGWSFYVGYCDDEPVATAAAFVGEGLVLVEAVSTFESHRRRGFGDAITSAATFTAPELPAMLISSDPGRGVYQRLGYMPITRYTLWIGTR